MNETQNMAQQATQASPVSAPASPVSTAGSPAVQGEQSRLDMILASHQVDTSLLASMDKCAEIGASLACQGARSIGEEFALVCAYDDLKGMMMGSRRLVDIAMKMQNNPMYFKTDSREGYPVSTVVDCMIQARLMGLKWRGNQFNILQGRLYLTKEGADSLISAMGVPHSAVVGSFTYGPVLKGGVDRNGRQMADVVTVDVPVSVYWQEEGKEMQKDLSFNIRMSANSTVDAVNGKAESHAVKWLYKYLTSKAGISSASFGEVDDSAIASPSPVASPVSSPAPAIDARKAGARRLPVRAKSEAEILKEQIREKVQEALSRDGEHRVRAYQLLEWLERRGTPVATMDDCSGLLECLQGTVAAMAAEMQAADVEG